MFISFKGGIGIIIWLAKAGYLGPICSSIWTFIKKICKCCCCCCRSKKKKDKYEQKHPKINCNLHHNQH